MKRWRLFACLIVAMLGLTGCFSQSAEDLYTQPKPPTEFENLDREIRRVLASGSEYAAPIQGSYTQQVQLMDLNGDGTQEAIAFFRVTSPEPDESPLKICIYEQDEEGGYSLASTIYGEGAAINSVSFVDVNGDKKLELVVSWQISGKVYQLMVYDINRGNTTELMRAGYTDFMIMDLDMDNSQEIVVLNVSPMVGKYQADFYDYDAESQAMVLLSSAPLSDEIISLGTGANAPKSGHLRGGVPALYVTSHLSVGVVTDVLACRDGELTNITLMPESGQSDVTFRMTSTIPTSDINGDNILEIPQSVALPEPNMITGGNTFWSVKWIQFDINGNAWSTYTTYYNHEDGWNLILPDWWEGSIALSRSDSTGSGEQAIIFSHWPDNPSEAAKPFLTIYKLTGSNRETRAQLADRFILRTSGDVIYAAAFTESDWDCGLDTDGVMSRFQLIKPD